MRIFLSGKVDQQHGKWRDFLLGEQYRDGKRGPKWELVYGGDVLEQPLMPWPTLPQAVLSAHDYVGPYLQTLAPDAELPNKHSGYFHGIDSRGQHGTMDTDDQQAIAAACMQAIDKCDMLFAYLNTDDCYGTLCEIGYARAKNKYIAIVTGQVENSDDMWFASLLANFYYHPHSEDMTEPEHLERAFLQSVSHFVARHSLKGPAVDRLVFSHG